MSDYDEFEDEFDHSPAPANLFGSPFPTNPGPHETFGGVPSPSSPSDPLMSPPPAASHSKPPVVASPSSPEEGAYDDEFDDAVEEEAPAPAPAGAPSPFPSPVAPATPAADDAHSDALRVSIPTLEAPSQSTDQYGVTRVVSRPSSSGYTRAPNSSLNGALLQAPHPTTPSVTPILHGGLPLATEGWKRGESKEVEDEYEEDEYKDDFGGAAATPSTTATTAANTTTSGGGANGGGVEGVKATSVVAPAPLAPQPPTKLPASSQASSSTSTTSAPTRSSSGGMAAGAARKGSAHGGGTASKGGFAATTLSSSGSTTQRAQSLAKTVESRFGKRAPLPSGSSPVRVLDAQRLGLVEPPLTERTAVHNAANGIRMAAIESTPVLQQKTTVVLPKERGVSRAALEVAAARAREAAEGEATAKLTELREHYLGILVAKDKTIKSTNKKVDVLTGELEALKGQESVGFKVSTLETLLREKDALISRLHDDNRQLAVISRSLEQQVSRLATEIALAPSRFQGLASELTVEREKAVRAKAEEAARRAEDEARERKIEVGVGELVSGYRLLVAQIRRLGHSPTTPEPAIVAACAGGGVFSLRDASNWITNSVTLSPREHQHQLQLQHSLPQKGLFSPAKGPASSKKGSSGGLSNTGKQLLSPSAQARLKSVASAYSGEGRAVVVSPSGLAPLHQNERGGDSGGAGAAAAVAAAVATGVASATGFDTKGNGGGKSRKSSAPSSAAPSRGASRGASRGGSRGAPGMGLGGSNKPLVKSLGSSRSGGGGGGMSGLGVSPQSVARSAALEDRLAQLEARLAQQQATLNTAIRSSSPKSFLTKEVPPTSSSAGGEGDAHSGISPAKLIFSASASASTSTSASSSSSSPPSAYAPASSALSHESKESDSHHQQQQPTFSSPPPPLAPPSNSAFTFSTMEDTSASSSITELGGGTWQRRTAPTAVGVQRGVVGVGVEDENAGGAGGKVATPPAVVAASKPRARDPLLDDDDEDGGGGYAPSLGGRFKPTTSLPTPRTDTMRQKYGGWGGLQNDSEEELEVETL